MAHDATVEAVLSSKDVKFVGTYQLVRRSQCCSRRVREKDPKCMSGLIDANLAINAIIEQAMAGGSSVRSWKWKWENRIHKQSGCSHVTGQPASAIRHFYT